MNSIGPIQGPSSNKPKSIPKKPKTATEVKTTTVWDKFKNFWTF
jgi:hypothetical protein